MVYHPEKIPSAIERYKNEINRVFTVLDGVLAKQEWLVGGKMTIADLSFIPWVFPSRVVLVAYFRHKMD